MPVTTTPQDILDGAYAKSTKNQPGQIATESTELLQVVIRTIRKFYTIAARVNPTFFAETASVAESGSTWARPETAESIFRIETSGTEVVVVPYDDQAAESGKPSVYRWGQTFREAGGTAVSGNLDFYYSKRPASPANLSATIDSMWTEQFNELLMLEVAIYLALKDSGTEGRGVEAAAFANERDEWLRLFIAFLEHETANERRRWNHIRRINSERLMPLENLLLGGTSVQLG